jgi:NAD(P)-dependent dehydrogenase (short-subunit alcohol dehydrogenase family)
MSSKEFEGKTVMIAGAAKGIGKVTSDLFGAHGANLVLLDIEYPEVENVLSELRSKYTGIDGLAMKLDITRQEDCEKAAKSVHERFGKIDVAVITAGVLQEVSPVKDLPGEEWDRVMSVNLKGPFLLCKSVVPYMIEQQEGKIITIASWYGHSGHAYFSAYCSSKAGLIVFTQTLAAEMAEHNVTVNTICPGNIATEMHFNALKEEAQKRNISMEEMKKIEWDKIPLKKAGDPEEIGNAVLFLSSEKANYITGVSLDVNGGVLFR